MSNINSRYCRCRHLSGNLMQFIAKRLLFAWLTSQVTAAGGGCFPCAKIRFCQKSLNFSRQQVKERLIGGGFLWTTVINRGDVLMKTRSWSQSQVFPLSETMTPREVYTDKAKEFTQMECMPCRRGHGKVLSLTKCTLSAASSVSPSQPHSPTPCAHTRRCTFRLGCTQTHWPVRAHRHHWKLR